MINSDTRSRLLHLYPILRDTPALLLEQAMANCSLMHVPTGTVVCAENEPCRGFPLLLAGSIRVIKASLNGRELQLYRVGPGDCCILAVDCLLGRSPYHAHAMVQHDLDVVVIPPPQFMMLYSQHDPFRDYIMTIHSEHVKDLTELLSAVAFQKLDQRLAALLSRKSGEFSGTHQDLADELGSVRVIVSRLLKNFADNGWLALGRERITILDVAALKSYAEQ